MPKLYFQIRYRLYFLLGEEKLRGVAVFSGVRHQGEATEHLGNLDIFKDILYFT